MPRRFIALFVALFVFLITGFFSTTAYASDAQPFLRNARLGAVGADIERLQRYLNTHGVPVAVSGPGSAGQETPYFGPATARALARYQELYASVILSPFGLTKGTGNFYSATRNFLNQLLVARVMPSVSVEPPSTPALAAVSGASPTYQLGGTATGLTGPIIVRDGTGNSVTIQPGGDARFLFPTRLQSGTTYQVSVEAIGSNSQRCFVSPNGKGTVARVDILDVNIMCTNKLSWNPFEVLPIGGGVRTARIGGTISGLNGTVVLQDNGGDELTLSSDGSFIFGTRLAVGRTYTVTVLTHPTSPHQFCTVTNGNGIVGENDITNISVNCVDEIFAYVTPVSPDSSYTSHIQRYLVGQDGSLSLSENATQTEAHYGQMAFATVGGTEYAYILEDGVVYCSLNSDGSFSHCAHTAAPTSGVNHPRGIAFATVGGTQYAYLTDPSSSALFQCAVNTLNGDLSSCVEYTDVNIDAAFGIAFNTDAMGAPYAYVADAATGMVVCPIDTDGSFMNPPGCAVTPSLGAPSWIPYGIAFTSVGGTRYAYVADNGISANTGHVYRCPLNADGTFQNSSCVATPADTSSYAPWNPYQVTFKTVQGVQYAYVVNNQSVNIGSIYRCTVNETTGLLNQDCIKTPDLPTSRDTWQPSGISFR